MQLFQLLHFKTDLPAYLKNTFCIFLLFLFTTICLLPFWSNANTQKTDNLEVWQDGFIRIFYTTSGETAVPLEDVNNNNIPDFVEDLGLQLKVSHHILCNIVQFPNPLTSSLFPDTSYVDIYVVSRKETKGAAGGAARATSLARKSAVSGARALRISVANDIDPKKLTVLTHEYFHLIQNSVAHITNGWYFEGTAVWVKDALDKRIVNPPATWERINALLASPEGKARLQSVSYKAADFLWDPLGSVCTKGTVHLDENDILLRSTYSDGSPVLKDYLFSGALLVKRVMEKISETEHIPFEEYNYGSWTKENRTNPLNAPFIFTAIEEAILEICY